MIRAYYQCVSCDFKWHQRPKVVMCPQCGNRYVHWRKWEEWRAAACAADPEYRQVST